MLFFSLRPLPTFRMSQTIESMIFLLTHSYKSGQPQRHFRSGVYEREREESIMKKSKDRAKEDYLIGQPYDRGEGDKRSYFVERKKKSKCRA